MRVEDHLRTTGGALKRWFIAQCQDALAVAVLWLVGLMIIGCPWAPLWAAIAGIAQFIPHLGPILSLIGPAMVLGISGLFGGEWMKLIYLLIVYASVVVIDGLVLQPYIMKRTVRVPIWASILTPIVMSMVLGFWGVLLSAPLLAVVYAYRRTTA